MQPRVLSLTELLPSLGLAGEDLESSAPFDLAPDGTYATGWIVATRRDVRAILVGDAGAPTVLASVARRDLKELAVDALVGGGALVALLTDPQAAGVPDEAAASPAGGQEPARTAAPAPSAAPPLVPMPASAGPAMAAASGRDTRASSAAQPGRRQTLCRFTHAVRADVARLAQGVNHRIKGQEVPADTEPSKHCPTCGRFLSEKSRVCPMCLKKGKVLLRLYGLIVPYWRRCLAILCLVLSGVAIDLVPPYLIRTLIDEVLAPAGVPTHRASWLVQVIAWITGDVLVPERRLAWLAYLVLGLVLLQLLRIAVTVNSGRMTIGVSNSLTRDLRARLFGRLQELSVRFYDKTQVGTLLTRVSQDTEEFQGFIGQATHGFLINILLIIGIGSVLFSMDWRLARWALVPAPIVMIATFKFWGFYIPRSHHYWASRWKINAMLGACLSGVRVVKAFAQELREIARFATYNDRLYRTRLGLDGAWITFAPMVNFCFGLGGLLIWYKGGQYVVGGQITIGTLMAFLGYLGMFYGPLTSLTGISDWLTRSLTIAQRTFDLLDETPDILDRPDAQPLPPGQGQIEFRGVSFGYDPSKQVLKDLSFTIQAGEFIGIVGKSGSGKTTISNLLARFYDVSDGAILVDGVDVRGVRTADLRAQIGIVLQEPYLFPGSIAENIAYGRPEATREDIIRAAKAGNAHEFIQKQPDGYDTRVGERGSGLSGGEKQRISIARALLASPRVLVLDEATSSVDTESERLIQDALASIVRHRTTIAIAHRLSTLHSADRIMVLEKGQIVEMGSHKELMARGGRYAQLIRMQYDVTDENPAVRAVRPMLHVAG